jgi:hypothetical protein
MGLSLFLRINLFAADSQQPLDSSGISDPNLFSLNLLPIRCIESATNNSFTFFHA